MAQLNVRVPSQLKYEARLQSLIQGKSLSAYIAELIQRDIATAPKSTKDSINAYIFGRTNRPPR